MVLLFWFAVSKLMKTAVLNILTHISKFIFFLLVWVVPRLSFAILHILICLLLVNHSDVHQNILSFIQYICQGMNKTELTRSITQLQQYCNILAFDLGKCVYCGIQMTITELSVGATWMGNVGDSAYTLEKGCQDMGAGTNCQWETILMR